MALPTLPQLDVVGPDGARLTVRSLHRCVTVRELARRLGVDDLWITRRLHPDERLVDIDELRRGSRLTRWCAGRQPDGRTPVVDVAVVAGPAVTPWRSLPAGRHLIGRSPHAAIRVEDPWVEAHHVVLDVGEDGSLDLVQLTGSVPIRVDGHELRAEPKPVVGAQIVIGSSVIDVRAARAERTPNDAVPGAGAGSLAPHPTDPWRRIVRRAPYAPEQWRAAPIVAPAELALSKRPAATGLVGAAVSAAGAAALALALGNPTFMVFALLGVVGTVVTFLVGLWSARRARGRVIAEHAEAVRGFRDQVDDLHRRRVRHHTAAHRTVIETMNEVFGGGTQLWRHRLHDRDDGSLVAVVGTGTHRWRPPIDAAAGIDVSLWHEIERCGRLDGVSAALTIRPGEAIGITGRLDFARAVVRSVITQLATWVGPADWQLVIVTSDEPSWRWADWLPHGAIDGCSVIMSGSGDELGERLDAVDHGRMTLLVTDEPHLFAARTGALRRFLTASNAASLVVVDDVTTVPSLCRRVLTIGSTGAASWSGDVPESDDSERIRFAGLSVDATDRVARRLACLTDPEDAGGSGGGVGGIPSCVSLAQLIGRSATSAAAIADGWRAGGCDPAPVAPLGVSGDGRVDVDLVRDGPHGLIAGTTGAGKSELLRTLVLSLAATVSPRHLNFVLVDYKGGSTFDACTALPHTVGLVTDLDDGLAERALISLDAELHRRERMLRATGSADLVEYRSRRTPDGMDLEPIARLVVVIDEFAALARELPDFLSALVDIAQRGRSLGVHLLLATQRPAGVVNDDIRANTNLRLALRLHDRNDALDVVGDELPSRFGRGRPGRAALRLGPEELVVFQAARCTGPLTRDVGIVVDRWDGRVSGEGVRSGGIRVNGTNRVAAEAAPTELEVVVQTIVEAAACDGLVAPHRPWIEPLAFPLEPDDLLRADVADDGDVIGLLDAPERQMLLPLSWRPRNGGLALVGSVGSGTTSTLIALAAAACRTLEPVELSLYVIDARGDDRLAALAAVAHCGGVVRSTEDERLHRLLARIVGIIERRISGQEMRSSGESQVVVMIDGFGSLRNALSTVERIETYELLQRVLNDGPAAGIALVVADDAGPAAAALTVSGRWVFHLDDPSVARGLGLRAAPVPHGKPGRFRVLSSSLEGQVVQGADRLDGLPTRGDVGGGPEPIIALSERVTAADLDYPWDTVRTTSRAQLVIGLSGTDLRPTSLDIPPGDHVLIVGGPRSGVTTALERCVAAWQRDAAARAVHATVVRIDRRVACGSDLIDVCRFDGPSQSVALVIDDAHRLDDDGTLMRIAQGEFAHITLIVGARADGVRAAYGHWTREVAKSRCGVVMASRGEPDGDVLGVQLPRRPLIPARPGLGWIVDPGPLRQVQIATVDDPSPTP